MLFHRLGLHLSLSGHWIILAYFLNKITEDKKYFQIKNVLIICLSSLIHFYFTLIILWIELLNTFYNFLKNDRKIIEYFKYLTSIFIPLLISMYLVGYFEIPIQDTLGGGYGIYKMNILSFINPLGQTLQHGQINWSNFLPVLGNNYGEKEGFSYFGLGGLILFLTALYFFFTEKNFKININFLIIILSLIIFSLSNKIDVGSYNLININLDKKVEAIFSIGRASGRFFWPVYYFTLFFSLIVIYKKFFSKGIYIILFLLIIQIIDIAPGLSRYVDAKAYNNDQKKLQDKFWNEIKSKNLILSSTFVNNGSSDFYKTLELNIQNIKLEINNLARYDRKKYISLRYENYDNFYSKNLKKEKVFLINNFGHLNHLNYIFNNSKKHLIINKDNLWMITDKENFGNQIKKDETIDKISSKKILLDQQYKPKFIEGSFDESFLGFGWANHRNNTVSDGRISTLLFNLSSLVDGKYEFQFNITPNILREDQKISISIQDKEYIYDDKTEEDIFFKFETQNVDNLNNFVINFHNNGLITEYDVLKSPDLKLIGFKLNYLILRKL